jgi:hypothetical protein
LLMLLLGSAEPWTCQCRSCRVGKHDQCQCGYSVNGIKDGVYWPRSKFKRIHTFGDAEMSEIRARHDAVFGACPYCAARQAAA